MASAWGLSWGKAWGNAWGQLSETLQPLPTGGRRRFLLDGVTFDVDEDDEEMLLILTVAAPLLNRRNQNVLS